MPERVSKTEQKQNRQAERVGRQLLGSLKGAPAIIARLAKGSDHDSWAAALRQACGSPGSFRSPGEPQILCALLAERDVSGQEDQLALFKHARRAAESGDLRSALILMPRIEPGQTPYGELMKSLIKNNAPDDRLMAILKTKASQQDWDGALFFLGQNGLRRSEQIPWARALVESGANPWGSKSAPLASAMGWGNWELADFLAPLSDPRRLAQLIGKAPAGAMPAARAFLERLEVEGSAQPARAPCKPAPRL